LAELQRRLEDTLVCWALETLGVEVCGTICAAYLPDLYGEPPPPRRAVRPSMRGSMLRVAEMAARHRAGTGLRHKSDAGGEALAQGNFARNYYRADRDDREESIWEDDEDDERPYVRWYTPNQKQVLRRRLTPLRRQMSDYDFACLLEDLIPRRVVVKPRQRYLFALGEKVAPVAPPPSPAEPWQPPVPPPWLFDPARYCRAGMRLRSLSLPSWHLAGSTLGVQAASPLEARREFALLLGVKRLPATARVEMVTENGVATCRRM
jgi:hypothetical protein